MWACGSAREKLNTVTPSSSKLTWPELAKPVRARASGTKLWSTDSGADHSAQWGRFGKDEGPSVFRARTFGILLALSSSTPRSRRRFGVR